MPVSGDNPIRKPEEDALGRSSIAQNLAEEIRHLDASEGCVVAVTGPWGSGKTSLLNLARHELEKEPVRSVLDFNPWMFSGAEQLVDSFFRELAAQLRIKKGRLAGIAAEIEAYGELLSPLSIVPFVGSWVERIRGAAGALKKFQERQKESVTARRAALGDKLAELESPIVVIIDDIDRLHTSEIRDIFKLVRLTASFPNVIYLLAFDRSRVEDALTETGIDGRNYLEKIVQVTVDVPAVPERVLLTQLGKALDDALSDVGGLRLFDEDRWPDVLAEIVRPLIQNMRDVRRYAASVRGTVRALNGEVELVDLLGLEAVRVFMPDAFAAVIGAQEALISTHSPGLGFRDYESPRLKSAVERIIEVAGPRQEVARAMIERLFPAGLRHIKNDHYGSEWEKTWLKARRVAHKDVLRLYVERVANEGMIAFSDAEKAYRMLGDEQALDSFLRSISVDRLQDVIAALETYEGDYPVAAVPAASTVLLNLLPVLPERERGMMDLADARLVVARVVLRLLRQITEPGDVEVVVDDVLPRLTTLSSRLQLVYLVGYQEGAGHKLVSEAAAARMEAQLGDAVATTAPADLAQDWDLLRLLFWAQRRRPEGETVLSAIDNPELNARLLLDARNVVRSQSMSSRAVRRETRLSWDVLVKIYGSEERLRQAIESIDTSTEDETDLVETLRLAKRYLTGWRPEEF